MSSCFQLSYFEPTTVKEIILLLLFYIKEIVSTSMATLTEGCTSSIMLLERGLLASTPELLRESTSTSMVPVAMATGDKAIVARSLWGGDGGAVNEFSDDWPQSKNLGKRE